MLVRDFVNYQTTRCHALPICIYLPDQTVPRNTHPPPQTLKSQQCHLFSPPVRTDRPHTVRRHICSARTADDHSPSYAKQYLSRYNDHVLGWASEESCFDPLQRKKYFCIPQRPDKHWGPPNLLLKGYRGFLTAGLKGRGQSRPQRRLRMSGAVPERPHSDNLQLPV